MPTKVFFNEPSEPLIILSYAEDFSTLQVSLSHMDHGSSEELFSSDCTKEIAGKIQSREGLDVGGEGNKRINLRYRRFLFRKKWRVMYEDVELSGIEVL